MDETYLVLGHLTRDLLTDDPASPGALGGTAAYAALTARSLGCEVAVVTAAADDLALGEELAGITLFGQPSPRTTTFTNTYDEGGQRRQRVLATATRLTLPVLPARWLEGIVHLGPVFGELDAPLVERLAPAAGLLAITPQGWLREQDADGDVRPRRWEEAARILPRCGVAVLSLEDLDGDRAEASRYADLVPTLVVTDGWRCTTVHHHGERRTFEPPATVEIDPTGAGDIFAAAYLVSLQRSGDPWRAAELANRVAADSVGRRGLDGVPAAERMAMLLED